LIYSDIKNRLCRDTFNYLILNKIKL
jgi:hypothetical protein